MINMIISKTQFHKIRNEIVESFNVVSDDDFMALDDELPQILRKHLGVKVDFNVEDNELGEIKEEGSENE